MRASFTPRSTLADAETDAFALTVRADLDDVLERAALRTRLSFAAGLAGAALRVRILRSDPMPYASSVSYSSSRSSATTCV